MLEVGVAPLTLEESRAHFSLWAILAAPLIAGNDLRSMSPETLAILANPEVLAVDQDIAGLQGTLVTDPRNPLQAWSRRLHGPGDRAVVPLNRSKTTRSVEVSWPQIGLRGPARARDLWRREDLGVFEGSLSLEAPGHGARMLRLQEC
jgi:alpha-galactosidase